MVKNTRTCVRFIPGLTLFPDHWFHVQNLAFRMRELGVPFKTYWVTGLDTIQDHAKRAVSLIEKDLDRDPEFQCHLYCHSMGGIVARYLVNHLTIHRPDGTPIPASKIIKSITTFATPHFGTPLDSEFVAKIMPASAQLSESGIREFNRPESINFSPLPKLIPFYSFGSYMKSIWQARSFQELFGYRSIVESLQEEKRDIRNDSVVPLESMRLGNYMMDINVPHTYFSVVDRSSWKVCDFYEKYYYLLEAGQPHLIRNTKVNV